MSKHLSATFAVYPDKLRCLNCATLLEELPHLGDSWAYPCHCPSCGLDHEFHVGGTVDTQTALYANFNPDIHRPRTPNYQVVEWIALILSTAGILLNANKDIVCWPVWIASCIAWILYFKLDEKYSGRPQPAAIILNVVFLLSNIYGWVQWSK